MAQCKAPSLVSGALTLLFAMPNAASAFSAGAPICEVNTLPLVEMSPTLAVPAPSGWYLESDRLTYQADRPLELRIRNANSAKQVRGVLLFTKSGPNSGAGGFALPTSGAFQYIPAPAKCGEWAISHSSPAVKSQGELQFNWSAPPSGTVIVRAFLIEDCMQPSGGCRDQQALTPVLILQEALFVDGFE